MNSKYPSDRPSRWPFPAPRRVPGTGSPGVRAVVADVFLAAAWAAMIPGLMWLGVAGGF